MNGGQSWRRWRATLDGWRHRDGRVAGHHGQPAGQRRFAAVGIAGVMAASLTAAAGPAAAAAAQANTNAAQANTSATQVGGTRFRATIVRTTYGVPHITADNFGSLGYGYGYALASDYLCTMARIYVTVQGDRSRYFGPYNEVNEPGGGRVKNLYSDIFWRSVIGRRVIPRLLAVRTGPGAVEPRVRQLMTGYVAGYNRYLASVGGSRGVPDPACRGQAWVKPITTLDAYLVVYQLGDIEGMSNQPESLAQPPKATDTAGAARPTASALSALAARMVHAAPGTEGLPTTAQLRKLGQQAVADRPDTGSNTIAIGSAGTRDHQTGMLLGNPHIPWLGALRMYQVQLTIPGTINVEGATAIGIPMVLIGFTAGAAWSESTTQSWIATPYQLTLVPGHPTEYVYNGKPVAMTSQPVTVPTRSGGAIRRTVWFSRYGPMIDFYQGPPLPWTTTTAFSLADADATNLRLLNQFLAMDESQSAAQVLSALKKYEGVPWNNTVAADATGHALYADVVPVPDVTNAKAASCDTAIGAQTFSELHLPILDGSRPSCAWGTDPDSAAPGIFGGNEEPTLMRRDFVENSNDSYWLANPEHPLTGYPRIFGDTGKRWGAEPIDQVYDLRTRSALTMVIGRIDGTDGQGPPGFTFADMKNLFYSDIQYGATLVKSQVVAMCRSFPGGRAPTGGGKTIQVGDSCNVLAAWNGRENPGSRGAVLFSDFWGCALNGCAPNSPLTPWSHPFRVGDPLHTPYGLNTASPAVRQDFGLALQQMHTSHQPYDVALGQVQYTLRDGHRFAMPGGIPDPNGELNAMDINSPGGTPGTSSTYIQVVTWAPGNPCPQAATVVAYSESDNPASPYYNDQTRLFSHREWATAYFSPAQVTAHALSTMVVSG
jgi:acyl-homoserine-lactone acylase